MAAGSEILHYKLHYSITGSNDRRQTLDDCLKQCPELKKEIYEKLNYFIYKSKCHTCGGRFLPQKNSNWTCAMCGDMFCGGMNVEGEKENCPSIWDKATVEDLDLIDPRFSNYERFCLPCFGLLKTSGLRNIRAIDPLCGKLYK